MIITGILVIKFGFGQDKIFEQIIGSLFITFGLMNLILEVIRRIKK